MRILFRKFPAADLPPPGPGEVYLLPMAAYESERSRGLANLVLKYGLDALLRGPGPHHTLVVDASFPHPTLDDMLAAAFARLLLQSRPVPGGGQALAQYAATLLQGLRPHPLAPEDSPEGIFLAVRNASGTVGKQADLTEPAVAEQFLADWAALEARLLESAAAGTDFAAASLFRDRPEFFKARGFLVRDRETYLADVQRGERWRVRLPGGPAQASGLYLHQPKSLLFPHWSRTDRGAPVGEHYLFLAVNWGGGVWMFSTDPAQRLPIGEMGAALQKAERARDADRADKDPWYDGRRPEHGGTVVGSPKHGSALTDAEVLRVVQRWAGARRAGGPAPVTVKALAGAAAAVVVGLLALLVWAALRDRQGPSAPSGATVNGTPAEVEFVAPASAWAPIKGVLKLRGEISLPADGEAACTLMLPLQVNAPRYARDHLASLIVTLRAIDGGAPPDVDLALQVNGAAPRQGVRRLAAGPGESVCRFRAEGCPLKATHNGQAVSNRLSLRVKNRTATPRDLSLQVEWIPDIALYLLSVGIARYQNGLPELQLPVKDARAVTALFAKQKGKLFADVQARTLINQKATREGILKGLDWLKKSATPFDIAVVAVSGHGQEIDGAFAVPTYDYKPDSPAAYAVSGHELVAGLAKVPCYGKLLILSTCYSGGVLKNLRLNAAAGQGLLVIASSRAGEETSVPHEWGYSGLTLALCEAVENRYLYKAARESGPPSALSQVGPDGILTFGRLEYFVALRMDDLNREAGLRQTTVALHPSSEGFREIPIARIR
jgi:hypothetical protein